MTRTRLFDDDCKSTIMNRGMTNRAATPPGPPPRKIHWSMLKGKGTLCRPGTSKAKAYKNPEFASVPEDITCQRCSALLPLRLKAAPGMPSQSEQHEMMDEMSKSITELGYDLEREQINGDQLAEALQYAIKYLDPDRTHAIAIVGTQITVGQVLQGVLLMHGKIKGMRGG